MTKTLYFVIVMQIYTIIFQNNPITPIISDRDQSK